MCRIQSISTKKDDPHLNGVRKYSQRRVRKHRQKIEINGLTSPAVYVISASLARGAVDLDSRLFAPGLVDVGREFVQEVQHEGAVGVSELAQPRLCCEKIESRMKYPVYSSSNLIHLDVHKSDHTCYNRGTITCLLYGRRVLTMYHACCCTFPMGTSAPTIRPY
jgi:hypothetical protein